MGFLQYRDQQKEGQIKEIRRSREKLERALTILYREVRDAAFKLRTLSDLGLSADDGEQMLAAQYRQFLTERRKKVRAFADEIENLRDREFALRQSLTLDHQRDVEQRQDCAKPAKRKIERIRFDVDRACQPVHGNVSTKRKHLTLVWVNPAL